MLNMQNVKDIEITEGDVRTIHDKDNRLIWGRLAYDTKYAGDTYQQTYTGKNLLPSNAVGTTTSHNVTLTVDATGRITVDGTADANVYFDLNKVTLPAGNYILSGVPFSDNSSSFRLAFKFGDAIQSDFSVNGKSFSLDTTYTASEAFLFIAKNYHADNLVFEPMIESGSSKTSYEPYTGGIPAPNPDYPQPIQVVTGEQTVTVSDGVNSEGYQISLTGKNLFNKNNSPIYLTNGATASSLANGVRATNSGGSQWGSVCYKVLNTADYIGKTITARAIISVSGTNKPRMGFTLCAPDGSNRQGIPGYVTSTGEQTISYTIESEDVSRPILALTVYANYEGTLTNTLYADYTDLQVEVGPATPYAPYYNYELCKIGDYQDYIYKSGDDWYVHKDLGKVVLVGSGDEDWALSGTGTPNFYYRYRYLPYATASVGLSNYFTRTNITGSNTDVGFSLINSNQVRFRPNFAELSVDDWKIWLSTHNTSIYYTLDTPTDTKITDSTLVDQLNAVHEWLTRYGYSSTVTGNLPIIINQTNL